MNSFTDYYYRSYVTSSFSFTQLFCIFLYYLMIALPFYFSFFGQNFWLDSKHNIMLAQITNSGIYALEVNNSTGSQYLSNIPGISSTLTTLKDASINIKDQQNLTQITIILKNFGSRTISSINFMTYFNTSIPILDRTISAGLQFGYEGNIQGVTASGMISFQQNVPINGLDQFSQINQPLYYPNFGIPSSFNNLIITLHQSPYGISKQVIEDIITSSNNNQDSRTLKFVLDKNIIIPVNYYPSILQTLKFKFLLFFAFFLVAYYFFKWFLHINLKQQTLEANYHDQVPRKWN